METDNHEWELSKENVQPLKQGRHMSALVAALHSDQGNGDEQLIIKTQQSEFEMELRTYSGDDPLDVWDRYIKWTEQYYPKGGHEGQLMKLIEQCLKLFQNDLKYSNDLRFIQVWLKFANLTEDPVEVFNYMFDIGVGLAVAQVYIEWATALERKGDLKRADAIYFEGLNRCTQFKDILKQSLLQFQSRVAQNITLQREERHAPTMLGREEKETRSALSRLKTHGNRQKVGVTRTGSATLGFAGTFKTNQGAPPKQKAGKSFDIFCDENVPPSLQPQQTDEWQSLPVKAVTNRENEKKPGIWKGVKAKQTPTSATSVSQVAPFEIHEDDCDSLQSHAPKTQMINSQPLSSWKATNNHDVLDTLRQPIFAPNTGTPMYQKEKIYKGTMEFSFEELRANSYWKRRAKREEEKREEDRKQREEWVKKQLEQQQAKIAALEAALLQTRLGGVPSSVNQSETGLSGSFYTPTDQVLHSSGQTISTGSAQSYSPQMMDTGASNSFPSHPAVQKNNFQVPSHNLSASRERAFQLPDHLRSSTPMEEDGDSSLPHLSHPKPVLSSKMTDTTPDNNMNNFSSVTGSSGRGQDMLTPSFAGQALPSSESRELEDGLSQQNQGRSSSSSADPTPKAFNVERTSIGAPSPTVYTKEAYKDILGMFNTTFDTDSFTGPTGSSKTPSKSVEVSIEKPAGDLQVYEDFMQTDTPAAPKAAFFIHEDTSDECGMDAGKGDHNVNMSRGSASSRKNGVAMTRQLGFVIHQDTMDENARAIPTPEAIECPPDGEAFKIWYGELQDENTCLKAKPVKQSIRRGLAFASTSGAMSCKSDDMETLPDISHYPEPTIEFQAKHDQTLAPLDHFTHHAMAASTPFTSGQNRSLNPPNPETSNLLAATASSTSVSITGSLVSTLGATQTTPSKNLSPIMEGSNENSNDDMKSLHSTAASSSNILLRTRHGSSLSQGPGPVREVLDDCNVSMQDEEQLKSALFIHNGDLNHLRHHQIDTTTYIPEQELEEATLALLSASIRIDPKDPFDDATIDHFLATLDPPLQDYPNYVRCKQLLPHCENDHPFDEFITFDKCIGKGGYAKVWKVIKFPDDMSAGTLSGIVQEDKALKIQKSGGQWEFYISSALQWRLRQLNRPVDVIPAILSIEKVYIFDNGSALEMEYMAGGSILNLVNIYKQKAGLKDGVEPFACLLTIQLLHLFEQMHSCHIIHGDVKPDNFLVAGLPDVSQELCDFQRPLVKLIDFGQSIDMTMFPPETTFTAKVETSGFQCIEMKTNRPWTYQTDLFGLAGTIHVVLFGSYMNVFQEHGVWRTTGNFVRKWNTALWKQLFHQLLNVPSCWQLPDLVALRTQFENHFRQNLTLSYSPWVRRLHLELNSS
ncbi:hypothetical protein RRG08_009744 [Elysia crispata]|uniref:Mitotic checkpoint serine/threonine-protein kinase BUB1 n=1 Tax=Elysia crispata TaxID=231223 RepID=A0AAE0YYP2_9GAST|nr:hypothetical protein RRG08_009744 [Elysia crispata]